MAQAGVWRIVLARAGTQLPFGIACRLSLAKLFVDQALPSLGVSGTVVVTQALEARGQPRPLVMATVAVDLASYFAAYVLSLAVALAILVSKGQASALILAVASLFFVFGTSLAIAVLSLSGRVPGAWTARLLKVPGIGRAVSLLQQAEPHLARNPSMLARATVLQVMIAVFDAATIWVLVRALGTAASPGAVFASFMISSLLRSFGFMPGGLGIFEAASVATLSLAGVPAPVGLSATLLFRGLSFWLPMLPGLAFSRRLAAPPMDATKPVSQPKYWTMAPEAVAEHLRASANGLSSQAAERRLAEFGPNDLSEREGLSRLGVLWNQLRSPLLLLLLFAAGASALTGEWVDAGDRARRSSLASVGIGYSREYSAQAAAAALRARVQTRATVLRDGRGDAGPARGRRARATSCCCRPAASCPPTACCSRRRTSSSARRC